MLFAVAFGQIIFERPVMKLLAAGPLEPGYILSVFRALKQLLVSPDRENDRDHLAVSHNDLGFVMGRFHSL
jgi:hypothetical protein